MQSCQPYGPPAADDNTSACPYNFVVSQQYDLRVKLRNECLLNPETKAILQIALERLMWIAEMSIVRNGVHMGS